MTNEDLAHAADALARMKDAIALLEPYVKKARNDADGHNWLAYAYRQSGQLEPAFAHYRRALQQPIPAPSLPPGFRTRKASRMKAW